MDNSRDTKPTLITTVTDVRRTPLARLAQQAGSAEILSRVLPDAGPAPVVVATFNSAVFSSSI